MPYRINTKILGRSGERIGAGQSGSGSYTNIDGSGILTMSGCGRVLNDIQVPAKAWGTGDSASTHATSGSVYIPVGAGASGGWWNVPTISPCSATCNMNIDAAIWAPADAATSGSLTLFVEQIVNTSLTTASTIGWRWNWNYINGVGTCSVKSGSAETSVCTTGASAKGTHWSASMTTQLPSFDQPGQLLLLHGQQLTGACGSGGPNVDFAGARIRYLSDKLGIASS